MAFEKLSVPQSVIDETLHNARRVGMLAAYAAIRPLEPYSGDIFREEQISEYGRRIADRKAAAWLDERIAGKHNDKESKRPGFTALVSANTKEKMDRTFVRSNQGNFFGMTFNEVAVEWSDNPLYIVQMPEGGYREISALTMEFFDVVEPFGRENVRATETATSSIRVGHSDVVTITGTAGEYWQNPNRNFDGSYRSNVNLVSIEDN